MAVEVLACERCLTAPAQVHDGHRDEVLCRVCCCPSCADPNAETDCAYCCEFVLSYVPSDLRVTVPARPTVLVPS